ncbi:uncharacterized protein MELLADRAFT_123531 [Melampsora larici-populina 98AG31]|uniref:Secreted protein n=1 Tax=Melampsora larici-populina (strain 98AG31 / pathotype 3-4-7) TaxID=747676 RepID=F4S6D4_MELLP|nr:uncharacterized protein MELLADRAFT_123531 [Melampsora larici-populina 98AG31]EGF99816.1 secreted protein [Melampsora larici-populina 98AG31]
MKYAPACLLLWLLVLASITLANLTCRDCGRTMTIFSSGRCQESMRCAGYRHTKSRCYVTKTCEHNSMVTWSCSSGHTLNESSPHPHGEQWICGGNHHHTPGP